MKLSSSLSMSKNFFDKVVYSQKSQFSFKGGKSSCTYTSLESSIYLLRGLIFVDDPNLSKTVEKILEKGVGFDQKLGHRSCDEVFHSVKRFEHQLVLGKLYNGRIKPGCYLKLLSQMVDVANGKTLEEVVGIPPPEKDDEKEEPKKEVKRETRNIAVVFTKPPETILLYYSPFNQQYPFIIFDSHPRKFDIAVGGGFYFFKTKENCANYLRYLYPPFHLNLGAKKEWEAQKYDQYEANYVKLRTTTDFMTATLFGKEKPSIKKLKEEQEDRDVISSLILSQEQSEKIHKAIKEQQQQQIEKDKEKEEVINGNNNKNDHQNILMETIRTLRQELEKTKEQLKEATSKLKEVYLVNESLSSLNQTLGEKEMEEEKQKELNIQIMKKIQQLSNEFQF